jgi:5'-methylthioadenosine phosphorylase
MTGHPEGVFARELATCYAAVTPMPDRTTGISSGEAVSRDDVLGEFLRDIDRPGVLPLDVISSLPAERTGCRCAKALHGLTVEFERP